MHDWLTCIRMDGCLHPQVFAEAYNAAVPDSWRVTNSADIVPSVPRLLGYAHVKHSVRLDSDGGLTIQADIGEDVFGEGRGGLDVIQELAVAVQNQVCLLVCLYCIGLCVECACASRKSVA